MGNCCDKSDDNHDGESRNGNSHDKTVTREPGKSHHDSKASSTDEDDKDNYFLIQTCNGHDAAINCMTLSPDESVLATGSDDGTIRVWTTKTAEVECIGICTGHEDYITCIAYQEEFLLSGSADNTIRRWDIATCECIGTYRGHQALVYKVICIGEQLLSSSYDRTVRMWDIEKAIELRRFTGHQRGVYPMIYINLQDLDIGSPVKPTNVLMAGERERHVLVTGSADNTAKIWSVDTGRCLRTFFGHENAVTCMTCDSSGSTLYTGSLDGQVRSWRMATSEPLLIFEGHQGSIIQLQVVAKILYSSSADRTVRAWVCETAINTRVYRGHKKSITAFKVHKGFLYTASGDSMSQIYSAKTAVQQRTLEGHRAPITSLAVVDDRLFTGSLDKSLRVWDASYLEEGFTLETENKIDPKKLRDRRLKAMAKLRAQQQLENEKPPESSIFVLPGNAAAEKEPEKPANPRLAKVTLAKRIRNTNLGDEEVDDGEAYNYGARATKGSERDAADKPKASEKKAFPGLFSDEINFNNLPIVSTSKPTESDKRALPAMFSSSSSAPKASADSAAYNLAEPAAPSKPKAPSFKPSNGGDNYSFEP